VFRGIGRVVWFLAYVLLRRLLGLVVGRSAMGALELENAVLRHQLAVLGRGVRRPPLRSRDRVVLAAASGLVPRARWSVVPRPSLGVWPAPSRARPSRVHGALQRRAPAPLALAAPAGKPPAARGSPPAEICRREFLGGVIHEYYAAAA
jgi:hypothetical protein